LGLHLCDEENGFWPEMDRLDPSLHLLRFLCGAHQWFLTDFSSASRRLRLGDPLSPLSALLFLLVIEAFTRMTKAASGASLISEFVVGHSNATISGFNLLAAHDTIIFC